MVGGMVPSSRFWERSRLMRFRQAEMESGRVELMELLARERLEREGKRQKSMGKEPASEALMRTTDTTEPIWLQVTPVQLQGVTSPPDQEASAPVGSERESFALCR